MTRTDVLGVRVRAFFFDPAEVDACSDFAARQLPAFRRARPQLLLAEGERGRYTVAELSASPDAVLAHGNGLICLSYKAGDVACTTATNGAASSASTPCCNASPARWPWPASARSRRRR